MIEVNKYKMSSCLLQETPMLTHTITTDANVHESTKNPTKIKTYETFYLWEVGEVLQKTEVLWNSYKTWWVILIV